jgi:hypothetical protein
MPKAASPAVTVFFILVAWRAVALTDLCGTCTRKECTHAKDRAANRTRNNFTAILIRNYL